MIKNGRKGTESKGRIPEDSLTKNLFGEMNRGLFMKSFIDRGQQSMELFKERMQLYMV